MVEGRDFITLTQKGERNEGVRGASISIEYHLTIEAAKHVAMMSGCDKGFEVRDYFLECERVAKRPPVAIDLNNPEFLRAALLTEPTSVILNLVAVPSIRAKKNPAKSDPLPGQSLLWTFAKGVSSRP